MNAGVLTIELAANVARLSNDMAQAKKIVGDASSQMSQTIGTLKSLLGTLGIGLSVGYFVSFIRGTNDAIAHMKELGLEAGTSGEAISRFEAPARTAGLGLEAVAAAMFKMNKASLEAKDPQSNAAQAIRAIGLSTEQLKGLKPDEMFELVARSISKYSDGLEKNNVMQQLFGKSGREMNRVVAEIASQGALAATVTQDQIEASKKLNDTIVELKMNSDKFWRGLVADGAPALNEILKAFLEARKEGSLLDGIIAGLSMTFEKMANMTPEKQLAEVNERIKNIQATTASWKTSGQVEEAARLNEYLMLRKALEKEIFDREFEAQTKRQGAAAEEIAKKPKIEFDPVKEKHRLDNIQRQAEGLIAFNEEVAKNVAAVEDAERDRILGLIAFSERYQQLAAGIAASRVAEGEAIAQSFDTDAQVEQRAYEEKLARLKEYFASKEDFTVQDQARLEAFEQQHQFNLISANKFGIKSRADIDKMSLDAQLEYYTGTLANITAAGAQHDKRLFELNKVAGIANAIVSTYTGAAAALKWGWPLGPIFAGVIIAAGLANVRAIASAKFGGGTSAPSVGGGTAIGTFPAPGSTGPQQTTPTQPPGQQIQIFINGNIIGQEDYVRGTLIPIIVGDVAGRDLRLVPPQSRNAQDIRDGAP